MPDPAASKLPRGPAQKLTARLYAIMLVTTLVTFGTLTTGYELLFTSQTFA